MPGGQKVQYPCMYDLSLKNYKIMQRAKLHAVLYWLGGISQKRNGTRTDIYWRNKPFKLSAIYIKLKNTDNFFVKTFFVVLTDFIYMVFHSHQLCWKFWGCTSHVGVSPASWWGSVQNTPASRVYRTASHSETPVAPDCRETTNNWAHLQEDQGHIQWWKKWQTLDLWWVEWA